MASKQTFIGEGAEFAYDIETISTGGLLRLKQQSTGDAFRIVNAAGTTLYSISAAGVPTPAAGTTVTAGTASSNWVGGDYLPPIAATGAGSSTSATPSATEQYIIEVFIPHNCTLTGVSLLVGATGGTDKVAAALYSSAGAVLANTALAGTTVGTAAQRQLIPFTATYAAVGPARYFINIAFDGTTARYAAIPVYCTTKFGQTYTGKTFGTFATLTMPAVAPVAATSPVISTY